MKKMGDYFLPLRALHMTCAGLSIAGFVLRWIWMLMDSRLLAARVTKIVPHVVDTLLLVSAVALVANIGFGPNAAWLSAKIAGLVVYIVLGTFALKRGRTKGARAVFGVLAILVFAFIASVARTHDPLGFLHGFP
ncbi:Protein SirB2 [Burkholderia sp. 8Y]|uniref:SirB2 family protein n=1 Tax=Burkholderia sp. 8Y TaxID=2653133 RepID=UPI0012EF074D|nr:SirB2 family protein [Burkholderia sp. 8Y]VXC10147.1 Protein SirB2 [Burkholderia sp. 8Y]